MVLEFADIRIHAGRNAEFEAAIQRGLETVISRSGGYRAHRVTRGIESPDRYMLMIWWETLEDHTVGFRGSPLFAEWRAIVGPFFAAPPAVEHFSLVMQSAGAPQ
jgi:heme-degrading monooxygenase HmoA